jgi:CRISPR-associated protein Csa3
MTLKQITHIVPVGHTKEKFVDIVKQFSLHKIVLVVGQDMNVSGEDEVYKTAKEIEKELKSFIDIEWCKVDKLDVFVGAIDILQIIKVERAKEHEVKINISGSLHTIGIACYIAALVSGTEIYSALPEYKNGKITGIKEILTIPFFPIKEIPDEQMQILKVLQSGSVTSVDELISKLSPEMEKGTRGYTNERARLSHHLKSLRIDKFLESEKSGKTVKLKLSRIGEIYILGKT